MKLLLTTMLFSGLSLANLPNEIDYSPYERQYNNISSDLRQEESRLSSSQQDLQNTLDQIQSNQNEIIDRNENIAQNQYEIQRLNNAIPNMEQQVSEHSYEARQLETQIYNLKQRIKNLSNKIDTREYSIRNLNAKITKKEKKLNQINSRISSIRNRIKKLKQKISQGESLIANLKSKNQSLTAQNNKLEKDKVTKTQKVSELEKQIGEIGQRIKENEAQITKSRERYNQLGTKLNKQQKVLKELIASNAPKEKIIAQRAKIKETQQKRAQITTRIKKLEAAISKAKSTIAQKKTRVDQLKREIAKIPGQINQNNRTIASNKQKIQSAKRELATNNGSLQGELRIEQTAKQEAQTITQQISRIRADKQVIVQEIAEIKTTRRQLKQKRDRKIQKREGHLNRVAELERDIYAAERRLPELSNQIRNDKKIVSKLTNENRELTRYEIQVRNEISQSESEIARLENEKADAYTEYRTRYERYQDYYSQAQDLGRSQTDSAIASGEAKGKEIAVELSKKNARVVGKEYGEARAKLIGYVRGELTGYTNGYQEGVNSQESVSQGQQVATTEALINATDKAQTTLKPQYFEEFYLDALSENIFKSVAVPRIDEFVFNGDFSFFESSAKSNSKITDLTQDELNQSNRLVTNMDTAITAAIAEDKLIIKKHQNFGTANFAYEAPNKVPYGRIDCKNVYKGVKDFIDACKEAYTDSFAYRYYEASKDAFSQDYPALYQTGFNNVELRNRNNSYESYRSESYDKVFTYAEQIGKKDAYDQSYAQTYAQVYPDFLKEQSEIARSQAEVEVKDWLEANPGVTVVGAKISPESLKGGDKGHIVVSLKNIGKADAKATGVLRLQNSANIILSQREYKIPDVPARSKVDLSIPFTVRADAQSNEVISFGARAILPGDKYKSARHELVKASETLILNPKYNSNLDYNRTPKVKGLRRYYVHAVKVNLSPVVENIPEGYKVEISVNEASKRHVTLKKTSASTGSIRKNEVKTLELSYVFKKSARKKQIGFTLKISYKGKVLKTENISVTPR